MHVSSLSHRLQADLNCVATALFLVWVYLVATAGSSSDQQHPTLALDAKLQLLHRATTRTMRKVLVAGQERQLHMMQSWI